MPLAVRKERVLKKQLQLENNSAKEIDDAYPMYAGGANAL